MPKLLIIEDQPALRETLCMALEQPDVKIRCAKDAEGGFLHALKWRPDVVITDYALPGMDGIELIKKIVMRKDKPLTPTPCVRSSGISPGARGVLVGESPVSLCYQRGWMTYWNKRPWSSAQTGAWASRLIC